MPGFTTLRGQNRRKTSDYIPFLILSDDSKKVLLTIWLRWSAVILGEAESLRVGSMSRVVNC